MKDKKLREYLGVVENDCYVSGLTKSDNEGCLYWADKRIDDRAYKIRVEDISNTLNSVARRLDEIEAYLNIEYKTTDHTLPKYVKIKKGGK